jgi:hypothetical protein
MSGKDEDVSSGDKWWLGYDSLQDGGKRAEPIKISM